MMSHIIRDADGNIVTISRNPQCDENENLLTEEIDHAEMIKQLSSQSLKWCHGYGE